MDFIRTGLPIRNGTSMVTKSHSKIMMADFFGRPTDIDDIGTIVILVGKELEARALDQNKIPSS